MTIVSLDAIVKNILLKRRYSLHFYLDFLVGAKDGLREVFFDEGISTLRYQVLTLNSLNQATLPNDYTDWAKVSARIGQHLHPLIEDNTIDTIPNYDSEFVEHPYIDGVASQTSNTQMYYLGGYLSPYWWMNNWNSYGENLGRQFGGVGAMSDTFKIDKARNLIKINENLAITEIVLEYIGNGLDADSATHIDAYAQMTIELFAMWQFKEHNRTYSEGEAQVAKQDYVDERLRLRARISDLTVDKLKRIVHRNAIAVKY